VTPYFFFFDGFGGGVPPANREFRVGGQSIVEQFQFTTLTISSGLAKQTGGTPTGSGIGGGGLPS
jgi:hypothetical protein